MSGVEVVKIDDDRIAVRGPNVADGYFPETDSEVLDGSAIHPGRHGCMVKSGNAANRSGITDFVNIAGKKVHPSVIEEHLRKLPGVIDAIVFGIPSATRNEELVAYVVSSNAVRDSCWKAIVARDSAVGRFPARFQIVTELPFNNRGKINRSELSRIHLASKPAKPGSHVDLRRVRGNAGRPKSDHFSFTTKIAETNRKPDWRRGLKVLDVPDWPNPSCGKRRCSRSIDSKCAASYPLR